jgi:hypothetical protein
MFSSTAQHRTVQLQCSVALRTAFTRRCTTGLRFQQHFTCHLHPDLSKVLMEPPEGAPRGL